MEAEMKHSVTAAAMALLVAVTSPIRSLEVTQPVQPDFGEQLLCNSRADKLPEAEQKGAREECGRPLREYNAAMALYTAQLAKQEKESAGPWALSLMPLSSGGWLRVLIDDNGQFAVFATRRQLMRDGPRVYVWFRWEHRHPEYWNGTTAYQSLVERDLLDCARQVKKVVSQQGYVGNNLAGGSSGLSVVVEEKDGKWTPVIPGTVDEVLLDWACSSAPARVKQPAAR
jgi:hypothetical protein